MAVAAECSAERAPSGRTISHPTNTPSQATTPPAPASPPPAQHAPVPGASLRLAPCSGRHTTKRRPHRDSFAESFSLLSFFLSAFGSLGSTRAVCPLCRAIAPISSATERGSTVHGVLGRGKAFCAHPEPSPVSSTAELAWCCGLTTHVMETSPLLKGQRTSGSDVGGLDDHGADSLRARSGAGPPFSHAAVFAVFFFPALGGLLFG